MRMYIISELSLFTLRVVSVSSSYYVAPIDRVVGGKRFREPLDQASLRGVPGSVKGPVLVGLVVHKMALGRVFFQ